MLPNDTPIHEKTCKDCGSTKSLSEFHHTKRDGFNCRCKPCQWAKKRASWPERYAANRQKFLDARKKYYEGHKAEIAERSRIKRQPFLKGPREKLTDEELLRRKRARDKRYREQNADRIKDRRKELYRANPHPARIRAKTYRQLHPEKAKAAVSIWKIAHAEKVRELNRKHRNTNAYRVQSATRSAKRRAIKRSAPIVEVIDRMAIAERDRWTCHICGEIIPKDAAFPNPLSLSVDHLVPLSKGGSHTALNISAAHYRCNCRRGAGRLPAQLRLV